MLLSGVLVYGGVLLAQIFFRADSVGGAVSVLTDMMDVSGGVTVRTPDFSLRDLTFLAAAMAIVWFAPNPQPFMASF